MAAGDQSDFTSRLQQLLPHGWFSGGTVPIRDALLQGMSSALSFVFVLLAYVRNQTRIGTATDGFLDMIAGDFFGASLPRANNQSDTSFRSRIIINIFRERATRSGVIGILRQLTGRAPIIFEPQRPADTGGYGTNSLGYSVAGGYGSMLLPTQLFVTAIRPAGSGIPLIAGYGISTAGYSIGSQGEYASLSMVQSALTDADIYAAIDSVRPVGYVVWANITNIAPATPTYLDSTFVLDSSRLL